jgi:hypothetical protein
MSANEELQKARTLIQAKRYAEARQVLQQIDHPTAAKWLARLDEVAPEKPSPPRTPPRQVQPTPMPPRQKPAQTVERRRGSGCLRSLLLLVLIVVVGGLGWFAVPYLTNQRALDERALTAQPPPVAAPTTLFFGVETATAAAVEMTETPQPMLSEATATPSLVPPTAEAEQLVLNYAPGETITMPAPAGWQAEGAAVHRGSFDTSGVAVAQVPPIPLLSLEQIVNARRNTADVISIVETTSSGRQVFIVEERTDDDETAISYYVEDSDGDMVVFVVQSSVTDKAALHEDILLMVGSVEAE